MSNYTAMLSAAVAEESSRGAALRGGISAATAQETARERFTRLGMGLGVPLEEWLYFYANDLNAIEQDAELTDKKLLAFMSDYAYRVRCQSIQHTISDFLTPKAGNNNKHHYAAALAVLQAVFAKHQRNLISSGYPATQARVTVGDWINACGRKSIPAAAVNELTQTKQVATRHGFVVLSVQEV